jgi:ABC-2 type transport system ATP-binding protein
MVWEQDAVNTVIDGKGVSRSFGSISAVDGIDFKVEAGSVLGLIGPNGAGKTTLLRALLGLTAYTGDIDILGYSPRRQRATLMEQVCFIADTAVLPGWMRVKQLLDYVDGTHPQFDRTLAEQLLQGTDVGLSRRVGHLSKGMTVQLHLALVMAIDARLLILDEPTLGLDILFRKRFFEQLLADYHHAQRTIIISTHQVEEVEDILTHVMFINRGKLLLHESMANIAAEFVELYALDDVSAKAQGIPHIGKRAIAGGTAFLYQGIDKEVLAPLGQVQAPSVADLFVALVTGDNARV